MDTLFAFAYVLLGHVPFFGGAVVITAALFGATKLFPRFGVMVNDFFDMLFGVDENYDETHNTGFRIHPANYTKSPSS